MTNETEQPPSARLSTIAGRISVVVADDDDKVRAAIMALLGDHGGFDLIGEAADGIAASQMCALAKPDLAVIDVMMPTGGCAAAAAIHAASPETVVCAYTARGDRRTRERLLACGIEAVFVKGRSQDLSARLFEQMQQRRPAG